MKNYRELADSVLERRDNYLAARRKKRKRIIRCTGAACCIAVVVLGISSWRFGWLEGEIFTNNPSEYYGSLGSTPSGSVDIELDDTTSATTVDTTPPTSVTITTKPNADISTLGKLYGGERIASYGFEGGEYVVGWDSAGDTVYMLIGKSDRCIAVDTNTGEILCELNLNKKATAIRVVGDEVWICVPSWKSIMIYNKDTLALVRQIKLSTEAVSFDAGKRYLVYTDSEQGGKLYRYDLTTGECIKTSSVGYYKPELVIDEKNGFIYVGDSASMGGKVYCLSLETLAVRTRYIKDHYGYCNTQRRMILTDDGLYWGAYKLDPDNILSVLMTYGKSNQQGMLSGNERLTILTSGVYDSSTGGQIIAFDSGCFSWSMAEITASGNAVFAYDDGFYVLKGWSADIEEAIS